MSQDANPEKQPLRGQTAVVTGGGNGIGKAIALRLAHMGAALVICGRTRKTLDAAALQITQSGGECETVVMDVASAESVEAAATQISTRFGDCRILVNNAGVRGPEAPLHEISPSDFEQVIATNLRGVYLCMRAFTPGMIAKGGGHIINISSITGRNAFPRGAAYAASKWAVNGLSYSAAEELRNFGIRVSVISPGSTDSNFEHEGKKREKMLQPENIAEVVAMLVTQPANMFVSDIVIRPAVKP